MAPWACSSRRHLGVQQELVDSVGTCRRGTTDERSGTGVLAGVRSFAAERIGRRGIVGVCSRPAVVATLQDRILMATADEEDCASLSFSEPAWQAVVLVCNTCKKRKNGSKKLSGGALLRAIKHGLRSSAPKPRVVATSCLGLCPKGATAVALVASNGAPQITAIRERASGSMND